MDTWELKPAKDLGLPMTRRHRSIRRESGLVATVLRAGWWASVRGALALCHRMSIHGREHVPAEPSFVVAANHASHLDALVIGAAFPLRLRDQLFPIAAGDVFFESPAIAAFSATVLNALPMWRKKQCGHDLADLRARLLEEQCAYILFPEGKRTRTGAMDSFKAGIGMLVAETRVPVVPCYLHGTFEAFPAGRWWPRFVNISLRFGRPLQFSAVPNNRPGWHEIAGKLEAAVRGLAAEEGIVAAQAGESRGAET